MEDAAAPEQLVLCRDRATGLRAIIAIDDTTLGPALGGIRMRAYPDEAAAVAECCRLAHTMTLKNALAEVGFGGGKCVVMADPPPADRQAAFAALGRFVARTGVYVPAADMGTSSDDVRVVAAAAPGIEVDLVDTSEATAQGVLAAIRAAVAVEFETDLRGLVVAVQGAGNVGGHLAELLSRDGAEVLVGDVDESRARAVAESVGGSIIAAADVPSTPCDVFAPCATAQVVTGPGISRIRSWIICGAANDVLASPELADALAAHNVSYVPDFVANAGGVIRVRAERDAWSEDRLDAALAQIGTRVSDVLSEARDSGATPWSIAERDALSRLGRLSAAELAS
jgi:leucine dehydrogenase